MLKQGGRGLVISGEFQGPRDCHSSGQLFYPAANICKEKPLENNYPERGGWCVVTRVALLQQLLETMITSIEIKYLKQVKENFIEILKMVGIRE